jgi:peroxiredoxin
MHDRKPWMISAALVAVLVAVTLFATPALAAGTVGEKAPGFTLTDLDGNPHSLSDYAGKLVVLEWINPNCPFSDRHAREKTMTRLADRYGEVVWLAINSTSADSRDHLSRAEHEKWADERGIDYTILYDESGDVGHAYDAKTTPHMYVVAKDGTLAYNGAIDDDPPGRMEQSQRDNYVADALDDFRAGEAVAVATTRPYGCSVKY